MADYKSVPDSEHTSEHSDWCGETGVGIMDVWQGVAMDSLKFHPGPLCPTLLCPLGRSPLKWPYSRFGVARPQGGRRAVVFYSFGHPTPYAYGRYRWRTGEERSDELEHPPSSGR
jgi:hypothetical protein